MLAAVVKVLPPWGQPWAHVTHHLIFRSTSIQVSIQDRLARHDPEQLPCTFHVLSVVLRRASKKGRDGSRMTPDGFPASQDDVSVMVRALSVISEVDTSHDSDIISNPVEALSGNSSTVIENIAELSAQCNVGAESNLEITG